MWRGVVWRGVACQAWHDVAYVAASRWRGVHVTWRGMAWRDVAWRARRGVVYMWRGMAWYDSVFDLIAEPAFLNHSTVIR